MNIIPLHILNEKKCNKIIINCIENGHPVSFSKYGDGEYLCASSAIGTNCDNDTYTPKLRMALLESFKYMTENCDNAFIGRWEGNQTIIDFWKQNTNGIIKWSDYHTFIFTDDDFIDLLTTGVQEKVQLYKTIKQCKQKKIVVCNPLLIKIQSLLNIDYIINIPFNNWFDANIELLIDHITSIIGNEHDNFILLTSCGMGSKVLICKLYTLFPMGIFLDIGSGMDTICTKTNSRGWKPTYEDLICVMKDLLPEDWEDTKYNYIYEQAKTVMGVHLR